MGGEVFELGNPEWRGAQAVLEIPVEGVGGSKNCAFHHGGVDFFWNNPFNNILKEYPQLAPVVQTLDSATHKINHYPVHKYYGNQLHYPLDRDLSDGQCYPTFEQPARAWFISVLSYFMMSGEYPHGCFMQLGLKPLPVRWWRSWNLITKK